MWIITDTQGRTITVDELPDDAYACDESGFEVDLGDLRESGEAEQLADSGYFGREQRRILIWDSEEASEDDPGTRAIASAEWQD